MKTLIRKALFRIFFKKIPKTHFGRCVECDANTLCGRTNGIECTATDEQQYRTISITNLIESI